MADKSYNMNIDRPFLMNGDCAEQMRRLPDASIDAIVTDPPYGLAFMGAKWDNFGGKSCGNDSAEVRRQKAQEYAEKNSGAPRYANGHGGAPTLDAMRSFQTAMTPIFAEALRVAKPGAHLLAFGGTRTYHRLACAIEDAGWEIRDCIMWVYGSGFPKSMDVSKAIDKVKGAERTKIIGIKPGHENFINRNNHPLNDGWDRPWAHDKDAVMRYHSELAPATPEAAAWNGWGTALKPACEPIVVARKPLEGTVAANVLKYGTGAINIDGCRVPTYSTGPGTTPKSSVAGQRNSMAGAMDRIEYDNSKGRWPANLIHDGSDEVLALFPDTGKSTGGRTIKRSGGGNVGSGKSSEASWTNDDPGFGDSGSAARFFYCAKASRKERDGSDHPTMKPLALMRYLVRLVTHKGGIVLDPFMGSGTTGVAAVQEGMHFVGVEKDAHYYAIALGRIYNAKPEPARPVQEELPLTTEAM